MPDDAVPLLLDAMLGKLSTYLRMCGYDAAYALDRDVEEDDAVLALAGEEGRTLLTRDAALAAHASDALLLESKDVADQLRELRAAGWALSLDDPSRCSACNGELARVEADGTPEHAPDADERRVWRCRNCGQHFWKGSHWESVEETLSEL